MDMRTQKSKALHHLLFCMKSLHYNIGIIGDYYYSIGCKGIIHRFNLRPDYKKDNYFPGIHTTKTRIGAKFVVDLISTNNLVDTDYCI